ncbi:GNAT family N-acetyltransferase [Actinoplanes sp. ATCC 53533]|uniref:GNAT family N-acetyltransferase n=1 Tax=Actinoplanes sp. ATCC 53533 TaxID=1288362 RepID=UPI000F7A83E0|nr:GNAT family N-acetyltransferase [Actinoplanes sp. ATCC 53533]RSM48550.1 GNAT family N-acetyltransferase [Actinoplanes sp. ATCC 53533]
MEEIKVREAGFGEPAVQRLIAEAMAELSRRYDGTSDDTPVAATDFAPPGGAFFVAYAGAELLGCAGWRAHGEDAELKRMFTMPAARGRGVAGRVLAAIEESARERGRKRVILETGDKQPEAIGLYLKRGYERIEDFGYYKGEEGVLSYARVL